MSGKKPDKKPEKKPDKKPDEEKEKYYHYTSKAGAKGIEESQVIRQSTTNNGDAVFGDGVYTTKIPPAAGRYQAAKNNYDEGHAFIEDNIKQGKTDYAVELDIKRSAMKKEDAEDRDVHRHKGDIDLKRDDVKYEIKEVEPKAGH